MSAEKLIIEIEKVDGEEKRKEQQIDEADNNEQGTEGDPDAGGELFIACGKKERLSTIKRENREQIDECPPYANFKERQKNENLVTRKNISENGFLHRLKYIQF